MSESEQPDPEALREHAEVYEQLEQRANNILGELSELADHDELSEKDSHQLQLIADMMAMWSHGKRFGETAYHTRQHAQRIEHEREWSETTQGTEGE